VADAPALLQRWTPDTLQLPVSMLDVEACEALLPQLQSAGIGVIARSVLAQGLLTDARGHVMAHESSHYSVEQLRERQLRSTALRRLASPQRTLAQTAVRFTLGAETTADEIDEAGASVARAVSVVRGIVAT